MSAAAYGLGAALLAAILAPMGIAGVRFRARFFPDATWAMARIVEAVVGLALLLGLAHILGSVGLFRRWPMALGSVVVGGGAWWFTREAPPRSHQAVAPLPTHQVLLVGAVIALVAASWAGRVAPSLTHGLGTADTLRYHMPFAAQFVQDGNIVPFREVGLNPAISFQTEDAELLDAIVILPFGRDFLVGLVNLFWLALTLVAAWGIGERGGSRAGSTLAVALLMSVPLVTYSQAGTAGNDCPSVAMLLAAVAIILNREVRGAAALVAGSAAGIAVGTKLYAIPVVAVMTAGILLSSQRSWRWKAAAIFAAGEVLTGAFWLMRNLLSTGSPLPTLGLGLGPIHLAHPASTIEPLGFTVWHYLPQHNFLLQYAPLDLLLVMGAVWPFIVVLPLAGMVLGLLPSGIRGLPLVAVAGAVAATAYLFTPWGALTFPGHLDNPILFGGNFRYFMPAAAIGLAVLPLAGVLRGPRAQAILMGGLALLVVLAEVSPPNVFSNWFGSNLGAALATAALVLVGTALVVSRRRISRPILLPLVALAAMALLAAGLPLEHRNEERRYMVGIESPAELYRWAHSLKAARVGSNRFQRVYPLFGVDLSNRVELIGARQPDGDFVPPPTCRAWRTAVNRGAYGYLVLVSTAAWPAPELAWTASDPASRQVLQDGDTVLFARGRPMDASSCPLG